MTTDNHVSTTSPPKSSGLAVPLILVLIAAFIAAPRGSTSGGGWSRGIPMVCLERGSDPIGFGGESPEVTVSPPALAVDTLTAILLGVLIDVAITRVRARKAV